MTVPNRRTFTISFPPELAAQVEQLAAQESRTTSELSVKPFAPIVPSRCVRSYES